MTKSLAFLHMPFSMGMGRAALHYMDIFKSMGYNVLPMNWYDFLHHTRSTIEQADVLFSFVVPQQRLLTVLNNIVGKYKKKYGMTVWETEEPPMCFQLYVKMFDTMFAPSNFTISKFTSPIYFLPHHVFTSSYQLSKVNMGVKRLLTVPGYKFYSISDFTDSRKNMKQMIDGFLGCRFPDAYFVIKHNRYTENIIEHPRIINIVGELPEKDMEFIHDVCHCYVNLSFSEGVGLGVIEAAVRNKPIIMTDYGGQNDYVDTPHVIKTSLGKIGFDEFLFTKDMTWGHPDFDDYKEKLKDVHHDSTKSQDHSNTRKLVSKKSIKKILKTHGL